MTADRPKFFSRCPVCNAETPQGAIKCPNCGVDLEIARANAIKDVALAAGTYGYSVAQQNNSPNLLNSLWYVVIGIVVNIVLSVLIWVVINFDLNSGFWFSLACAFSILYFAAWGRYGKVNFYGFMNLLVWSAIPLINLVVFYYLGRGLHLSFAKLELPKPPVATSAGTIIIVVLLVIGAVSMMGNINNPFTTPPEPTLPRPTITAKPAQLTLEAYYAQPKQPAQPSCLLWSQVTTAMKGTTRCVQGIVMEYRENWDNFLSVFYFGTTEQFFFVSNYRWNSSDIEGKCIYATGEIQLNTYKVPYIKIDENDLYYC
jgi:hypothetical protein